MHGCGNDYVYVNAMQYNLEDPAKVAMLVSDRHKGIGSDGLVLIDKANMPEADFSMRIFNADGSEAMMCGNASRCIGKYLYERGLTEKTEIRLLTLSGIKVLSLTPSSSLTPDPSPREKSLTPNPSPRGEGSGYHRAIESVTVDMGEPVFENPSLFNPSIAESLFNPSRAESPLSPSRAESNHSPLLGRGVGGEAPLLGRGVGGEAFFVSMGNPHYVIFTDDVDRVGEIGPELEHHPAFPQRCNIELARIEEDGTIRTRVWERGSGITMACGTGACATAVAAASLGRAGRQSQIVMDGGTLSIEWRESDNHVYMTGPATFVFDGEIEI